MHAICAIQMTKEGVDLQVGFYSNKMKPYKECDICTFSHFIQLQ